MLRRLFLLLLPCLAVACRSSQSVEGLAPARKTGGPRIVFDLSRRPLAEIPFPNDLATTVDSGSPTGRRLNSSVALPSTVEQRTRALVDQLDGFGTYAPITVSFETDIDLLDLTARQNDADPTNDAIYLVQLDNGRIWPVDLGGGPERERLGGHHLVPQPDRLLQRRVQVAGQVVDRGIAAGRQGGADVGERGAGVAA